MDLALLALVGALGLDLVIGEPPNWAHPVAWFGRAVAVVDRPWRFPRVVGIVVALVLPTIAALAVGGTVYAAIAFHWLPGAAAGALVVFVTTSFRALVETSRRVNRLASSDLSAARTALIALVGRDTEQMDEVHTRSAIVESLAENFGDGLVAPLGAFALGSGAASVATLGGPLSLTVGCACAAWVKGVNTMDAMLGYPTRPLGSGAARLDDLVMVLPARLGAALLAVAAVAPASLWRGARWRDQVASPNAGWPMGTAAAALGVRLEKPGRYVLNPTAPWPSEADVERATVHVGIAGLLTYGFAGVIVWI